MGEVGVNDYTDYIYDESSYEKWMKIYCKSTRNVYEEFRRVSSELFSSTYHLKKYQHKVDSISLIQDSPLDDTTDDLPRISADIKESGALMRTAYVGFSDRVLDTKIAGNYSSYLSLIYTRHSTYNRHLSDKDDVIAIESFDGAEHSRNHKNSTSVISFSSQMLTPTMLNSESITAGSSSNIYTWQQLKGTEKPELIFPAVRNYFNLKSLLYDETSTITNIQNGNSNQTRVSFYDLQNGKMLHLLTQHSQWNRKYHPFLSCTCGRGNGGRDETHTCKWLTDIEQKNLFERSKRR